MHELSLAKALLQLADEHRPPNARVRTVYLQAGPWQSIDQQAMIWAWESVREGTPWAEAALELELLPWQLRCLTCGRCWDSVTIDPPCTCGSFQTVPTGGDALLLTALEIDDDDRPDAASP